MSKNNKWESAEETKVGCLELVLFRDSNGIMLAPMCKGDGNEKCFTSSNNKQCEHNVTTVKLDEVGDYIGWIILLVSTSWHTLPKYNWWFHVDNYSTTL
jgi:hypothetical protein